MLFGEMQGKAPVPPGKIDMRTLVNVVLFVVAMVLFGSVVPAAAQGGQDQSVPATVQSVPTTIQVVPLTWIIGIVIAILGMIGGLFWKLEGVRKELDGKIDSAKTALKEDSVIAHDRIEGNIRDSEGRITGSVKTDVDRLYNLVKDSEDRITGSVKTDVDRLYNLMIQKKDKDA